MPSLLQDRIPTLESSEPLRGSGRCGRRRVSVRLAVAGLGLAVAVPLAARVADLLPGWTNPFHQQVVDRSTPALLTALDDLAEYRAARGTFQVMVDVEHDTPYVPAVISGERVSFLATGTVDAFVDFGNLGPGRVETSPDRHAVTITLPAPQLAHATVDPATSRVVDRDRGLLDRIGSAFEENPSAKGELYSLAEHKLADAAAASDLRGRAEKNTRDMLGTLAGSLGYDRVTVTFTDAPA